MDVTAALRSLIFFIMATPSGAMRPAVSIANAVSWDRVTGGGRLFTAEVYCMNIKVKDKVDS